MGYPLSEKNAARILMVAERIHSAVKQYMEGAITEEELDHFIIASLSDLAEGILGSTE